MSIHDDAEAARRKVYDDALSSREATITALTGRVASLTGQLETAGVDADAMRATIAELRARIEELTAPAATPSPGLWFKRTDVVDTPRRVFAHWHVYPRSKSNQSTESGRDYWETGYLPINGAGGAFADKGGALRDRPISDAPYTGVGTWRNGVAQHDIRDAVKYGLDGFFVNIMGHDVNGENNVFYLELPKAAQAGFPGFAVIPEIDCSLTNAGWLCMQTPEFAAAYLDQHYLSKAPYITPDGYYAVGAFQGNKKDVAWWKALFSALEKNHGKKARLFGAYNDPSTSAQNAPVAYAAGPWGPGSDPNIWRNHSDYATPIRARGEKYMAAVWWQDVRNGNLGTMVFDDAQNTEGLLASWDRAIRDNADYVQLCTWNDYGEGSHHQPSVMRGSVCLELDAYRIEEFKTGRKPKILTDYVVVSHRNQMANATITGGQTQFMAQWVRPNRSTFREAVEVRSFLTAPRKVTVKVGSASYTYDAPAGESAKTFPMQPGVVTVSTDAGLSLVSPVAIRSSSGNQDRQYAATSTLSPVARQYDPTPAK